MIALEDIVLAFLGLCAGWWLVVKPIAGVLRQRKDPVAEAKKRLRVAQAEAEAARLDHEAEQIIGHLYDQTLNERTKEE